MGLIEIPIPKTIARTLKLHAGLQRRQQSRVLKIIKKARYTEFGQAYHFDEILLHGTRKRFSSGLFLF